ncbi:MAG: hypothetical protein KKH28_01270 [Elusimicrobia bacterium]|nr:hypothetical protein [Elusimicrobiota bacterium]
MAVVSGGVVSQQDIPDWQAAQGCYGPDALTSRKAGFMRMFEATILDEVLQKASRPITAGEYQAEVARIDAETRAPEILACIKKYFGDDTVRYQRIFIRPILAQRFIREFVKFDPRVQEKAYGLRDKISTDVVKGIPFNKIASTPDIVYSSAAYSLEADTATQNAFMPHGGWSPFEAAFIEEHLKGLKPGQVKEKPIEDETNIKFIRLISVTGKKYYFELLTVHKLSTEEYLKAIPKLPSKINDKELHDWVAPIKGNPLIAPAEIAQ